MSQISRGMAWKLSLLSGKSPTDATDELLDNRLGMSNYELMNTLLPMAQLRAEQIERGLESDDAATRQEAERMQARYTREPNAAETVQAAYRQAEELSDEHSPLTKQIAANWMGKILGNELVGEMEKELSRTVDTYKREKEENKLTLRHRNAGIAI